MKKYVKALSLVLAVVFMLTALVACGGGGTTPTDTGSAAPTDNNTPNGNDNTPPVDDGTVYKINIDYPNPENSAIYPALVQWADYLREQTNGRIDATIYSGGALGSLMDCVTNCESGVTDGFWSGITIYAGVFPATEVMGLPMMGTDNQYVLNDVINALVAENEDFQKEWENLHIVALHSSSTSPILFAKEIDSIEDMAGMNLRISNAYTTEWFTQLGANPVSLGINDGYEGIQKSVIDGGLFFFDQVQSSALYEVIKSIYVGETIAPLTMFCLNKDVYESLPADLQAAVDDSGDYFLSLLPDIYQKQKDDMLAKCEEYNVKIIYEDEASREFLSSTKDSAWQKWVEKLDSIGYDGQALLDTAVEYVEYYKGVHGDN